MDDASDIVTVGETCCGRGVFARRRFKKNAVIGEILGKVIDDPDYSSLYCMDLGGSLSLEPAPPFRFLNHSCEPNCELFQWVDENGEQDEDSRRRMWLAAVRKIEPGEELTIDYAWPADAAIRCLCNTPSCRGWIVDPSELPLLQSRAPSAEIAG